MALSQDSKRLKLIYNIIILMLSLYSVSKHDLTFEETTAFNRLLINSFAPLQRSIVFVKENLTSFFNHYVLIINTAQENQILKKKVMDLESTIFHLEELRRENLRLKDLLKFGREIEHEKVLAQVVGWDASSQFRVLRINKGAREGIRLKSPVVTSGGLVGHIYRLTDHFADILTILDQHNRIDAIVDRTRSHGIIEGHIDLTCIMKYVTRTEPVALNDNVITSGLGNIYPKGLKIGSIARIERESYGITQLIEIIPSVDFRKIEEVIVLVAKENPEGDQTRLLIPNENMSYEKKE